MGPKCGKVAGLPAHTSEVSGPADWGGCRGGRVWGQRENSGEHKLGTDKRLLMLELEEHREGDVKGCRLGLSLVKDYLVLPGL